jgi:hypothetical protein
VVILFFGWASKKFLDSYSATGVVSVVPRIASESLPRDGEDYRDDEPPASVSYYGYHEVAYSGETK